MNFQQFLQQPLHKRHVFKLYWPSGWYILPKHIPENQYDIFQNYLKDTYPYQHKLREKIIPYIINTLSDLRFFPTL